MNESRADYLVKPTRQQTDDDIIAKAVAIMARRLKKLGHLLGSPDTVKLYLRTQMHQLEHEQFHVLFLDVRNRLIASEVLFTGTLTSTSVHSREVVKAALRHNAASVMLAHNHPSGVSEPSPADLYLTGHLKHALELIDVRVMDHFIVAGLDVYSFAENGQI